MGTAVSTAARTAINHEFSHNAIFRMVEEATIKMIAQPEVKYMIAAESTNSDRPLSPICNLLAKTVKQEAKNVEYINKNEPDVEITAPLPPSSVQSDSESSEKARKCRGDHRAKKNWKTQK